MPPRKDESRQNLPNVVDQSDEAAWIDAQRVVGTDRARITMGSPPPDDPLQTQEQGILTGDEVDAVNLTNYTGGSVGTDILDKDTSTEIEVDDPTLASQIEVVLNNPLLVSDIAIVPGTTGSLSRDCTITITDPEDNDHIVYQYVGAAPGLFANGLHTKPFRAILASTITIDFDPSGGGNDYDVSQLVVYKDKGRQQTVAHPMEANARETLTEHDVNVSLGGGWSGDWQSIFSKDEDALTNDGSAYPTTLTITPVRPTIISRIAAFSGDLQMIGVVVTVTYADGEVYDVFYDPPGTDIISFDTKDFKQKAVTEIEIQFEDTGATAMDIQELMIYRDDTNRPYSPPERPQHTIEEPQVVDDQVATYQLSDYNGAGRELLDQDMFTIVDCADPTQAGRITMTFRRPTRIRGPITILPDLVIGSLPTDCDITLGLPDGTTTVVYDRAGAGLTAGNVVTRRFGSILVSYVQIDFAAPGAGNDYSISEVNIPLSGKPEEIPELRTFYGQYMQYDPMEVNGTDENYSLMREPLETDVGDSDADYTDDSFSSDAADSERISVDFHAPHLDIRKIRAYIQGAIRVECSDNCTISSVRVRAYRVNVATGAVTALGAENQVGAVGSPLIVAGPDSLYVPFVIQDPEYARIPFGEVFMLRVRVFGAQVASDATPSWVRLWHRRGHADVKAVTELIIEDGEVF